MTLVNNFAFGYLLKTLDDRGHRKMLVHCLLLCPPEIRLLVDDMSSLGNLSIMPLILKIGVKVD